jgi:hypothetical protein
LDLSPFLRKGDKSNKYATNSIRTRIWGRLIGLIPFSCVDRPLIGGWLRRQAVPDREVEDLVGPPQGLPLLVAGDRLRP